MKKNIFFLMATVAMSLAVASCEKEPDGPAEVTFPDAPKVIEENLEANPEGDVLTLEVAAEGVWTLEAFEEYDWIEANITSGNGYGTIEFTVVPNSTAKERSAEYVVKETFVGSDKESTVDYTTYSVFVSQGKPETNLGDGTYEFLQQLINGKMLGAATPEVDNWYNFDEAIDGIVMTNFDGKLEITAIAMTANPNLCDFPSVMNLPELTDMRINECSGLTGKVMPAEWNTPKLEFCNIAASGLTGEFPKGLAASEKLMTLYANNNYFYGVYPHDWASDNLQCLICCNINNHGEDITEPFATQDSPGMGYMVPAQMDVILNKYNNNDPSQGHCNESRDLTQMKIGGAMDGNYIGFEAGWGQHRYEKFDPDAIIGDEYVWSIHRLLVDEQPASFFSNMGYHNCYMPIPQQMLTWDQAAADEWTKEATKKYGK